MNTPLARQVLPRLAHEPLHEQVYRHIRRFLMEGAFQPGQVLTIRDLAAQLGTSVMPVRDALQKLTVEQVLELTPARSVRVPVLSAEKFTEICEARMVLEGAITRIAARRATPEDIACIERAEQEFISAREAKNPTLLLQKNREFHFAVYAAARHATLMQLIEPLWVRCGPCTLALFEELTTLQVKRSASSRHNNAIAALRARKPAQAEKAITSDIRATNERYCDHVARGRGGT
jgi:DNA-binding GntR family transcriptional regulator